MQEIMQGNTEQGGTWKYGREVVVWDLVCSTVFVLTLGGKNYRGWMGHAVEARMLNGTPL